MYFPESPILSSEMRRTLALFLVHECDLLAHSQGFLLDSRRSIFSMSRFELQRRSAICGTKPCTREPHPWT